MYSLRSGRERPELETVVKVKQGNPVLVDLNPPARMRLVICTCGKAEAVDNHREAE